MPGYKPPRQAPPEVIRWIEGDFRRALESDALIVEASAVIKVARESGASALDCVRHAVAATVLIAAGIDPLDETAARN